jgi:predicted MFS family arabinose efflux permease
MNISQNNSRPIAIVLLSIANFAMSVNQSNVSSIFLPISLEFNETVYGLGILASSFFLSYAAFEVPGGIFAAKFGPAKIVIVGTAINTISVILSGLAPTFVSLVILRFFAGIGFSFAFPSILILIVRYFKKGSEGLGVGLMGLSSNAGFIIGLSVWPVLASIIGWRSSLLTSGSLDLISFILILSFLPRDQSNPSFTFKFSYLRDIIFNRSLGILSIVLFGFGAAIGVSSNFIVFYLETSYHASPALAGLIAGSTNLFPIFTSLFFGRMYDGMKNPKFLVFVSLLSTAFGVMLVSISSLGAAIIGMVVVGSFSGIISVIFVVAKMLASSNPEFESATVAWVDSFSLFGNFAAPIFFSFVAIHDGYSSAWLLSGLLSFALCLPWITLRVNRLVHEAD